MEDTTFSSAQREKPFHQKHALTDNISYLECDNISIPDTRVYSLETHTVVIVAKIYLMYKDEDKESN